VSEPAFQENRIDEYVKADDSEAAVKLLFDLIVENAKAKNFTKAEALREKLFQIDDMALPEIVRSGEIIEEEKTGAMDQNHREIWSKLYSTLTMEEANALYYNMKEESFDANVTLFEEGKPNDRLFFINLGDLKMVYSAGEKEMLLKNISAGDVAGEDTFFGISYCTTSLITMSRVQLHMLEKNVLEKLIKNFPVLRSKIKYYCLNLEQVSDLLKKKNLDRRTQKRLRIKGPVIFQVLNKSGERLGIPFKGTLSDISTWGLSFYIKTPKKETVQLLLGRRLNLKFSFSPREPNRNTDLDGTVVGVCDHFFNDYSVHIKFDQFIDEKMFEAVNPKE
jgi:CRP-like cAMP-binding protein